MDSIKILQKPDSKNPYAVIYKPKGLPSAPLSDDDRDNALCQTLNYFPEFKAVHGKKEIEHGLLHRLDTATDGLMLIAGTQDFYDFMNYEQAEGRFIKYYTAKCNLLSENPKLLEGFPPNDKLSLKVKEIIQNDKGTFCIESFFRPYGKGGKEVRPVTNQSTEAALKKVGKKILYTTEIVSIKKTDGTDIFKVTAKISKGFRHQVRCHLCWAGLPVLNDSLYNSNANLESSSELQFSATRIEFINPVEKKLKIFNEVL